MAKWALDVFFVKQYVKFGDKARHASFIVRLAYIRQTKKKKYKNHLGIGKNDFNILQTKKTKNYWHSIYVIEWAKLAIKEIEQFFTWILMCLFALFLYRYT